MGVAWTPERCFGIGGSSVTGSATAAWGSSSPATRSAGPALFEGDTLFVDSSTRARDLRLPGLRVAVRPGHAPLADDPPWRAGLRRSSVARALVENLAPSRARGGVSRTLSEDELADWVALLAQQYPPERLNRFRDRSREVAAELGLADRYPVLDRMFATALGTAAARPADLRSR